MRKNVLVLGMMSLLLGTFSCGKMDDTYKEFIEGGERIYAGRVLYAYAMNGNEKVTLHWKVPTDPNINEFRVFWNNRRDSLAYRYDRQIMPTDSLVVELKPLPPATYYFEIYSYDTGGRRSVKTEFTGVAYPKEYVTEN